MQNTKCTSATKGFLVFFCSCLLLTCYDCHSELKELTPQISRNIELFVRANMNVPASWSVTPERPRSSNIPGYDALDIHFDSHSGSDRQQSVSFLISKDREHLARLSNFAINNLPATRIRTVGLPFLGTATAPVEIIEFDDLECPFCARMDASVMPSTLERYKGLIKVIHKEFPLVDIHPWALHAAVNAQCLAAQAADAYWDYIDMVHARSPEINKAPPGEASLKLLDAYATQQGVVRKLNRVALDGCVLKQDHKNIDSSIEEGNALGVDSTPTLFIDGERFVGQAEPALWDAVDRALKAKGIPH